MSTPRKIYSEDKMKELISREGDGEEVPEGSKIFYYPDSIEVEQMDGSIIKLPNVGPNKKVKSIIKTVSGKLVQEKGDPGNIKSKEKLILNLKEMTLIISEKKKKTKTN